MFTRTEHEDEVQSDREWEEPSQKCIDSTVPTIRCSNLLPSRSSRVSFFFFFFFNNVLGVLPQLKLILSVCVCVRQSKGLTDRNLWSRRTSCWVSSNSCLLLKSSVQWWKKQMCVFRLSYPLCLRCSLQLHTAGGLICRKNKKNEKTNVCRPPNFPAQSEAKGLRIMAVGGTLATGCLH